MRIPIEFIDRRTRLRDPSLRYPRSNGHDPENVASTASKNDAPDHDESSHHRDKRAQDPEVSSVRVNGEGVHNKDTPPVYGKPIEAGHSDKEKEEWKDRCLRLRADFENYKRHAEADKIRMTGLGKDAVLDDIFPIIDHLERAIKAVKDAGEQNGILEGMELVYREFLNALEKHGVKKIETIGKPFNPNVHEAVAVITRPEYPEHTVVQEVRNGYIRGDTLLRPTQVVVTRKTQSG
jgi:molecular chaperone GrpE